MLAVDVPDRGDWVGLAFTSHVGGEQVGYRPARTMATKSYNKKVGLALVCPVKPPMQGYPFEVCLPNGLEVGGVLLLINSRAWNGAHEKPVRLGVYLNFLSNPTQRVFCCCWIQTARATPRRQEPALEKHILDGHLRRFDRLPQR